MSNRVFKLQDFAEVVSTSVKPEDASNYERFVGLEHYDAGEPVITRYTDTSLLVSAVKEFKENDILIARRNVYLKRAGIVFFSGVTSGDSIILRIPDTCIDKTGIAKELAVKIIPFVLNSEHFWAYANKHADGMNSKRISKDMLLEYEFELSSNELEEAKSEKLWAAYRLKESYKRLIAATDEMVKSQFIEMFGDMKYLTSDKTMSDFFDMKAGQSITAENIIATYDLELFPCYGGNGLRGYVTHYTHEGHYCLIGRQGALCGNVNLTDGKFFATEHAIVVTPKISINTYWLFFALSEMNLNRFARGVAQPGLSVKQLETIPFSIPPTEEQEQFERLYRQADKSKYYEINET